MADERWAGEYENLLSHIEHHNVRGWLMEGARREDARTIMAAIKNLSDGQLQRRFARMLSGVHS